jgi:hypothetical protein
MKKLKPTQWKLVGGLCATALVATLATWLVNFQVEVSSASFSGENCVVLDVCQAHVYQSERGFPLSYWRSASKIDVVMTNHAQPTWQPTNFLLDFLYWLGLSGIAYGGIRALLMPKHHKTQHKTG